MSGTWQGGMRVPPGENRDDRLNQILIGNPVPITIQDLWNTAKGWAWSEPEPSKPYQFYLTVVQQDDGSWTTAIQYIVEPPVE